MSGIRAFALAEDLCPVFHTDGWIGGVTENYRELDRDLAVANDACRTLDE